LAEPVDYSPRGRRGRGRCEERAEDYEIGEVFDSSLAATHRRNPDGSRAWIPALPVHETEIVPADRLKAVKPKEEFEGYTGNAGMTLERWYRHAAIFLWPNEQHLRILCEAGSQAAVPA
jgi:hypothetical protein